MHKKNKNDFLFLHFEKFIFAVLVGTALLLVYRGMQMPDYLQKEQPERLEQGANQVKTSIDEDHWERMNETESRLPTMDVVGRTNQSISPIPAQAYRMQHPWERKAIDVAVKRTDPVIAVPLKLRVAGVATTLAVKSSSPDAYALFDLENAEKVAAPVEPPGRTRRPPRGRGGFEGSMGPEMSGDPMLDMIGGGSGMMSESMMGMGMGMGAAGLKPPVQINAKSFDQGFRPTGVAMGGMSSMGSGSASGSGSLAGPSGSNQPVNRTVPVMGHFVAGVAVVPHRELFQSFMDAFQQADGFNPQRDRPTYIGFQLQRADVTGRSVDSLTESDWVNRGSSRFYQQLQLRLWAGAAKEIVSEKYRDPELTTAVPPVLLDNYAAFASHPDVPLGDEVRPQFDPRLQQDQAPTGPIVPGADDEPFANTPPTTMLGSGSMMSGGMYGSGSMSGGGMYGSESMMGGMSGYGGMGMMLRVEDQPDYKLIRFYDFRDFSGADPAAPVPGRQYVYRLRIAVEDPNFPANPGLQPRSGSLSSEVFRRVEAETAKATETKRRNSVRWSEFSEPSGIVSLPPTSAVFAGQVTPAQTRKMQLGGKEIDVQMRPPTGKLVVSQWSPEYQVPIPAELEVTRGSVLAKRGDVNVPDPLALIVKKLPDADVNTQGVVVDLAGGEKLAISTDETQLAPSVMLWFTPDGGLKVSDEITANRDYRLYTTPDEKAAMP